MGHPGVHTLHQVLSQNSLLVSPMNKYASVCNAMSDGQELSITIL
jgi:hypothetical protein